MYNKIVLHLVIPHINKLTKKGDWRVVTKKDVDFFTKEDGLWIAPVKVSKSSFTYGKSCIE